MKFFKIFSWLALVLTGVVLILWALIFKSTQVAIALAIVAAATWGGWAVFMTWLFGMRRHVCRHLGMNLKAATIRLMEAKKGKLKLEAAYGLSQSYLERGPLDEELATYYLKQGEPVVIPDAREDVHTIYHEAAEAEGITSILAVPISVQDEIIGILRLLSAETRYFSHADIGFAMAVAEQGGVAIQRAVDYAATQRADA